MYEISLKIMQPCFYNNNILQCDLCEELHTLFKPKNT